MFKIGIKLVISENHMVDKILKSINNTPEIEKNIF